jgi:hypothetical protein
MLAKNGKYKSSLAIETLSHSNDLVVIEALQRNIPLLISNIPEFLRFELPNHNYAEKDTDYSNLILANKSNISKFKVSSNITSKIMLERDLATVCSSWSNLIHDILYSKKL